MHKIVKEEYERITRQFPNKEYLSLDDYAALFGIPRRNASRHLRNTGMPIHKLGTVKGSAKNAALYVAAVVVAEYLARCKGGVKEPLFKPITLDDMKDRRGFNQLQARRKGII